MERPEGPPENSRPQVLPGRLAYGPIAPSEGRGRGPLGVRFDSVRRRDKP